VRGNNDWYIFECLVPGLTIRFEEARTQRILAGGRFRIIGSDGNNIILTRITVSETVLTPSPPTAPDASLMWQIDVMPTAVIEDMRYVTVKYSDARAHPVATPDDVTVYTLLVLPNRTCYKWLSGIVALNSFTEDSDKNGKIDRIRVSCETSINYNFLGFAVDITGYDLDTSLGIGNTGFSEIMYGPYAGAEFYIHLVEKPYTDTGETINWTISGNTTLRDDSTGKYLTGTIEEEMVAADTAPPKIAYTLAVPGRNEVFIQFSEPVVHTGGTQIETGDITYKAVNPTSLTFVTTSGLGAKELIATFAADVAVSDVIVRPISPYRTSRIWRTRLWSTITRPIPCISTLPTRLRSSRTTVRTWPPVTGRPNPRPNLSTRPTASPTWP
jgi:hypothetical protein